jgi:hypothetical protein
MRIVKRLLVCIMVIVQDPGDDKCDDSKGGLCEEFIFFPSLP